LIVIVQLLNSTRSSAIADKAPNVSCHVCLIIKKKNKAQLTQRERATAVHVWRPTANKCKIRKKPLF